MFIPEYDYAWIVSFLDGTKIRQFNDDHTENKFELVLKKHYEECRITKLSWVPWDPTRQTFTHELQDGDKPILLCREYLGYGNKPPRCTYMIGSERLVDGKSVKDIAYFSVGFKIKCKILVEGKLQMRDLVYSGAVERSPHKNFVSKMDYWARQIGKWHND